MRHGFLLVDKPAGPTSHDIVGAARRALNERNIGHLGTLDPAAEGLLVLAVGTKALKTVELFSKLTKEYVAGIRFGAVSTTYDREGAIEEVPPKAGWEPPDSITLRRVIEEKLTGRIDQVPPGFSAVKIGGERAYRKMRQGREVNLPPRAVEIFSCKVLSYAYPDAVLDVHCGSGTYIRSLAHDLGQLLRCGAYLSSLRRTGVGKWSVHDAVVPDQIRWTAVVPLKDALAGLPRLDVDDEGAAHLRHGRDIVARVEPMTIAWSDGLPFAILEPSHGDRERAHARKVL